MRERPVIFTGESVRAILAGTKTQTRRVAKFAPLGSGLNLGFSGLSAVRYNSAAKTGPWVLASRGAGGCWNDRTKPLVCPYGEVGSRLWVRETFARIWANADGPSDDDTIEYRADTNAKRPGGWDGAQREEVPPGARWRSPIHMPRWASRLTLEITSVRVERVRAITEGDARAEGVLMLDNIHPIASARDVFAELWDSINGKRPGCSWADNPWCWCLQFRRIDA